VSNPAESSTAFRVFVALGILPLSLPGLGLAFFFASEVATGKPGDPVPALAVILSCVFAGLFMRAAWLSWKEQWDRAAITLAIGLLTLFICIYVIGSTAYWFLFRWT
jgi:hypothetical protein